MKNKTIHFISLGCPKNRVDTEVMLGIATTHHCTAVADPTDAEIIVVNTCGFIHDAKKESVDAILASAAYKQSGQCKTLVVTGCLAQRYPKDLAAELPEVDYFIGSGELERIADVIKGSTQRLSGMRHAGFEMDASLPRALTSSGPTAYVKIAEGCDRRCAFCVIPRLRGNHRSRGIEDVVREAQALADQGIYELNLVSQDTSAFGRDLGYKKSEGLSALVEKIADIKALRWVRVLYLYPDVLDARLLELMASHPKVLPYVDMPMQHAADEILSSMRRGHSSRRLRQIVETLRDKVPSLVMRTAFIVGFPGETKEHFSELKDFVKWAEFDHVGVFRYSDEEDSHAFALTPKVGGRESAARAKSLMQLQQKISRAKNEARVGQTVEVIVEGASEEHEWVITGRHAGQAPEIDGRVYFTESDVKPGELWTAEVLEAHDYDLVVKTIGTRPLTRWSRPKKLVVLGHSR